MPQNSLAKTLRGLVRRHGISSVLHSLADIQDSSGSPILSSSKRKVNGGGKSSAVDYVARMGVPPDKVEVMARAAQSFDDKAFLPSIADIREFCRIHDVDLGKSSSRVNSIPRVFTCLVGMDTSSVTKVLDDGIFSGPTRLAPIADAIRRHSGGRRRTECSEYVPAVSNTARTVQTKNN